MQQSKSTAKSKVLSGPQREEGDMGFVVNRAALLRASLKISLAVVLAFGACLAQGQAFLETLSWTKDWNFATLGNPGGTDIDPYGDLFTWNSV